MLEENGRIDFCDELLELVDEFVERAENAQGGFDAYARALAAVYALVLMRTDLDAALVEISRSELFEGVDLVELLQQAGLILEHVSEKRLRAFQEALGKRGLLGG